MNVAGTMSLEAGMMQGIADAVTQQIQNAIPQIVQAVMEQIDAKIGDLLPKVESVNMKMFSIRDDVHRILEGLEIEKNKKRYSDVVIYGARETKDESNHKKFATNLTLSLKEKLKIDEAFQNVDGDPVLMARRLNTNPKVGETRPLVITLATDKLRDTLIKVGNKYFRNLETSGTSSNHTMLRFKDNVCRKTRMKRRVLGYIAGALRKDNITAVVPYDVRAKLFMPEVSDGRSKKLKKLTYSEAVKRYGTLVDNDFITKIRDSAKDLHIEQILLL